MRTALILAALLMAASLAGCFSTTTSAQAKLRQTTTMGTGENVVGWANFTQKDGTVTVDVVASGLSPGEHGVHVHENGECGPTLGPGWLTPGGAAGGHFNPDNRSHPDHAGDLGNLVVGQDGRGTATFTTERLSLTQGSQFNVLDGRSVIVHAQRDDGGGESGNAGARELCGVIGE
jgi:Cu-Zn family superoxide dismutase